MLFSPELIVPIPSSDFIASSASIVLLFLSIITVLVTTLVVPVLVTLYPWFFNWLTAVVNLLVDPLPFNTSNFISEFFFDVVDVDIFVLFVELVTWVISFEFVVFVLSSVLSSTVKNKFFTVSFACVAFAKNSATPLAYCAVPVAYLFLSYLYQISLVLVYNLLLHPILCW